MGKFNVTDLRHAAARGPLATEPTPTGVTFEGAPGFKRDARSELFLRATTTFVGEDAFYETANQGADRLRALVRELAVKADGWEWLQGFLPWLRGDGNVRTAGILLAAEAVKARLDLGMCGGGHRQLIDAVLQRADEPGELVAYWLSRYGKALPKPVKRGISDAVGRLYTERAFLRYDSGARGVRFGDVLELVHARGGRTRAGALAQAPQLADEGRTLVSLDTRTWQDDLFRWAITARHNREGAEPPESLKAVRARWELSRLPALERHAFARQVQGGDTIAVEKLDRAMAGSWEWLMSWLGERADITSPRSAD